MENNRAFKFIWRANAIVIFIAGLAAAVSMVLVLSLLVTDLMSDGGAPPPAAATVTTAEAEPFRVRLSNSYSDRTVGQYTYFDLESGEAAYGKFSSGGNDRQRRNIGVFDLQNNTTRWVFPNAAQEITNFQNIPETQMDENGETVITTVGFLIITKTSLQDGSIQSGAWVMRPNGDDLRSILSEVNGNIEFTRFGENPHRLTVETKTDITIYAFDTDSFKLGEAIVISAP